MSGGWQKPHLHQDGPHSIPVPAAPSTHCPCPEPVGGGCISTPWAHPHRGHTAASAPWVHPKRGDVAAPHPSSSPAFLHVQALQPSLTPHTAEAQGTGQDLSWPPSHLPSSGPTADASLTRLGGRQQQCSHACLGLNCRDSSCPRAQRVCAGGHPGGHPRCPRSQGPPYP